ncbi:hypothetical protein BWK63_09555 [Flavobacterium covae]|uniref:Uncharacterized protein n=1 Tax=Flavobacterium covae TaxID=2906076 RepID=A0ABW8PJ59_9FLAO|nr:MULTISPECIES: hypothetical protein [Flavobacterium]OWP80702.1 hypothetical protein BWK63_09555 [Flavobacterium covae]POR21301.1 hypothetical protein BWK57_10495 [Flavobacterium columnare]
MENQKQIKHNQSLFDVTIQRKGTIEALFEVAFLNNVSITGDLLIGTDLLVSNGIIDKQIVNYFLNKKIVPATALTQTQIQNLEPQGIGYMIIENDFTVR